MSIRWVSSVTRLRATPRAIIAVRIGSPIATTEPKVISSTMIAAERPTSSAVLGSPCWLSRIASPPSSTCSRSLGASSAAASKPSTVASSTSKERRSSWAVASAIVPSPLTTAPRAGEQSADSGDSIPTTPGTAAIAPPTELTSAQTAGSESRPSAAWKTTWTPSPDWSGKRCSSSDTACSESESGSSKLVSSPRRRWQPPPRRRAARPARPRRSAADGGCRLKRSRGLRPFDLVVGCRRPGRAHRRRRRSGRGR